MLKDEEGDQQPLDLYANQVAFTIGVFDVTMTFGLMSEPGKPPKELVRIRMSPQHALVLSKILQKNMEAYSGQVGKINLPQKLYKELGLEPES